MRSISRTESPPDKPERLIRRSIAGTPRLHTSLDNSAKGIRRAPRPRGGSGAEPAAPGPAGPAPRPTGPAPGRPRALPGCPRPRRHRSLQEPTATTHSPRIPRRGIPARPTPPARGNSQTPNPGPGMRPQPLEERNPTNRKKIPALHARAHRAPTAPAPPGPRSATPPSGWVPRCPRCVVLHVRRLGGILVSPVRNVPAGTTRGGAGGTRTHGRRIMSPLL